MDSKENQDPNVYGETLSQAYLANSSFLLDASPKRPFTAQPLKPLHGRIGSNDINFSRKRESNSPIKRADEDGNVYNVDKKHKKSTNDLRRLRRTSSSILQPINGNESNAVVASGVPASSPIRQSRFQEASMHDRPSEKPPSLFLRSVSEHRGKKDARKSSNELSVDQLMEEYHMNITRGEAQGRLSTHTNRLDRSSAHTANPSISSNLTSIGGSNTSKESGLFRLSKAINPVNLWNKYRSKETLSQLQGASGQSQINNLDQELIDRQIRAEQVYAEYKKAGTFNTAGSRYHQSVTNLGVRSSSHAPMQSNEAAAVSVPNLDKPLPRPGLDFLALGDYANQPTRARNPSQQRVSAIPGSKSGSKFHIRSPSMQDLKRIASGGLHKRAASSFVLSTEAQDNLSADSTIAAATEAMMGQRISSSPSKPSREQHPPLSQPRSRKNLAKQAKLNRRISDLESKLQSAKKELEKSVSNAVPMPQINVSYDHGTLRGGRTQHLQVFGPMPTLYSESLLAVPREVLQQSGMKISPAGPPVPPKSSSKHLMEDLASQEGIEKGYLVTSTTAELFVEEVEPEKFAAPRKHVHSHSNDNSMNGSPRKLHRPRANIGPIPIANPAANNGESTVILSDNPRSSLETLREERASLSSCNNSLRSSSAQGFAPSSTSGSNISRPVTSRGLPTNARGGSMSTIREQLAVNGGGHAPQQQKLRKRPVQNSGDFEIYTARPNSTVISSKPKFSNSSASSSHPRKKLTKKHSTQTESTSSEKAIDQKPFEWPSDCF